MPKKVTKDVYYCDHCNKRYLSKYWVDQHEKWCLHNPENKRACCGCKHLDKVEHIEYEYHAYNGQEFKIKYTAFVCNKYKKGVYPISTERKVKEFGHHPFEEIDGGYFPNEPMPKECEGFEKTDEFIW